MFTLISGYKWQGNIKIMLMLLEEKLYIDKMFSVFTYLQRSGILQKKELLNILGALANISSRW